MGATVTDRGLLRREDRRLVTGAGRYVDDIVLPGMLHACFVRSPHPHAAIEGIEFEEARGAPGVRAVLTARDWKAAGFGPLPRGQGLKKRDGSPMYRPDYVPLAGDKVRWVGDPVAMVVADTLNQALDAAELVSVDYRPLPAVTSAPAAATPGAPLVWEDCPDNICFVHRVGDEAAVAEGFSKAARVVRQSFPVSRVSAATMEPRSCIGSYDEATRRYTTWAQPQRPHPYRKQAAEMLGIGEDMIRIVTPDVGGSFGMKSPVFNENAMVLLAARLTGRPVKWTSSRSEGFVSDSHGRDALYEAEMALDEQGHFLAMRVTSIVNLGAYLQVSSETSCMSNLGGLAGVYRIPAIHVDATTVFTNTNPIRPYRGNGRPEATYVIERMVDLAARACGLSPVEIRRRNMIATEALPYKTGLIFTYDCGDFRGGFERTLAAADYEGFEARREASLAKGRYRGLGIAAAIEQAAIPGFEAAEISFGSDGVATLYCGASSQGQGHETVFSQIVAEQLGLAPDEIVYVSGDTDQVKRGEGTGSSRSATFAGSATLGAAKALVENAKPFAAEKLGVAADEVSFAAGIFSAQGTNRTISLPDLARQGVPLSASSVWESRIPNFPNACHVCEVEVDARTGETRLVAYHVTDDVGVALSHELVEGQLIGGIAQGIGQALLEEIRFDPDSGQLMTGSFMDYGLPRAGDLCPIETQSNPVPTKTNPLGVKGAGETGCVGGMAAMANAIADALAPLGVGPLEMPLTGAKIWAAIRAAQENILRDAGFARSSG